MPERRAYTSEYKLEAAKLMVENSFTPRQVTGVLQRIDPIWDVLHPEEQRRVLELLVDELDVGMRALTG